MSCNNIFVINRIMNEISGQRQLNLNQNLLDKLVTSVHTATTSNHLFKNRVSLGSCYSSISIESNNIKDKYLLQRKLFMKYLLNKHQQKKNAKVLQEMKNVYANAGQEEEDRVFGKLAPPLQLQQPKYSQNDLKTLNHFCGIWLLFMGYKTQKNKSMIMDRIRLELNTQQLYSAVIFYEELGAGLIQNKERWEMILETCLNGWESFCKRAIQFSRRQKSINNNNFHNKIK